jgi:hypothetical protein
MSMMGDPGGKGSESCNGRKSVGRRTGRTIMREGVRLISR